VNKVVESVYRNYILAEKTQVQQYSFECLAALLGLAGTDEHRAISFLTTMVICSGIMENMGLELGEIFKYCGVPRNVKMAYFNQDMTFTMSIVPSQLDTAAHFMRTWLRDGEFTVLGNMVWARKKLIHLIVYYLNNCLEFDVTKYSPITWAVASLYGVALQVQAEHPGLRDEFDAYLMSLDNITADKMNNARALAVQMYDMAQPLLQQRGIKITI
jgi:hypothetical protein